MSRVMVPSCNRKVVNVLCKARGRFEVERVIVREGNLSYPGSDFSVRGGKG